MNGVVKEARLSKNTIFATGLKTLKGLTPVSIFAESGQKARKIQYQSIPHKVGLNISSL